MLAVAADARRNAWVDRPEPNSKARLSSGKSAATSSRNWQLKGGKIQAGVSAGFAAPSYFRMSRSS